MQAFAVHTGVVAPLDRVDVDTDQIIPKQFITGIARSGYAEALFHDWRVPDDGTPHPEFVLNHPGYQGATILVAGRNFGCGSSREHAPWALRDYGFRAVVAPSFGDIFAQNSLKSGLLVVTLPEEQVSALIRRASDRPGYRVTVDLERNVVEDGQGLVAPFAIDEFRRQCLLRGLDDIGLTLQHQTDIGAYEARRASWLPVTTGVAAPVHA